MSKIKNDKKSEAFHKNMRNLKKNSDTEKS